MRRITFSANINRFQELAIATSQNLGCGIGKGGDIGADTRGRCWLKVFLASAPVAVSVVSSQWFAIQRRLVRSFHVMGTIP
jgi:hypothetical protein